MEIVGKKSYYMIVSAHSDKQDEVTNEFLNSKLLDTLYRMEYNVIKLGNNITKISYLAFKEDVNSDDNNTLRKDSIEIIEKYYIEDLIVKYYNEKSPKKLKKNGHEKAIEISNFNGDPINSFYTNEGISFSFLEKEEYILPKSKSDFKKGNIVEIKNNKNEWVCREVIDVDKEWSSMYKLLIKYGKVRCLINYDTLLG